MSTFIFHSDGASWGFEPEFTDAMTNVTVPTGRDAILSCSVTHLGGHKVPLRRNFFFFSLLLTQPDGRNGNSNPMTRNSQSGSVAPLIGGLGVVVLFGCSSACYRLLLFGFKLFI